MANTPIVKNLVSGKEFNELFHDQTFYKLTTETENHNNFQFVTGLNIDVLPFLPIDGCKPGGLYFTDYDNIHKWWIYNNTICNWYRVVTIPDDAKVYIQADKYKANKFILSDRKEILMDEKLCYDILSKTITHGNFYYKDYYPRIILLFSRIKLKTLEMCEIVLRVNGYLLRYIKRQTEYLCRMAVEQNSFAICYVNDELMSLELCELAVKGNGLALQWIAYQYRTPELCKLAVQQNGLALGFVHDQTPEIIKLAVLQNGLALKYVQSVNQTPEIIKLAVQRNGSALAYADPEYCTEEIYRIAEEN